MAMRVTAYYIFDMLMTCVGNLSFDLFSNQNLHLQVRCFGDYVVALDLPQSSGLQATIK